MIEFNSIYGWIALITAGIIILQFIISFVFGEFDIDLDADGDMDFDMSTIVSPKGIIHFLCGASWYLLLCGEETHWYDYIIALGIGVVLVVLIALVYWAMGKLANYIKPETGDLLVGRAGNIYLTINKETYTYIIKTTINSSQRELTVVSKSKRTYATGEQVVIVDYQNGIYYID